MNSETKKKIENAGAEAFCVCCNHYDEAFILGAEYGHNLAIEQANEILVKALEQYKNVNAGFNNDQTAKLALEAWKKLTGGEKC